MIDFLTSIDTDIFLMLNGLHCPFLDQFMRLFSERFIWIPMYAALLALIIRHFGLRRGLIILCCTALAITLADQLCATFIRPAVQRLRPANLENPISGLVHIVNGYRGGPYGFPSCHAANTFALAVFMCSLLRTRAFTIAMAAWVLITCYSRIYLGVHYPGDLITGAIIGSAIGYGCYMLASMLATRHPAALWTGSIQGPSITVVRPVLGVPQPILRLTAYTLRQADICTSVGAITVLAIIIASIAGTV